MNDNYVKDYKEKELRQYIIAFFLITASTVTIYLQFHYSGLIDKFTLLIETLGVDLLIGAISVLVIIVNEMWPRNMKHRLIYKKGKLPSCDIFTRIGKESLSSVEFDIHKAKDKYKEFADKDPFAQQHEWNRLLIESRKANKGNVIEAERMYLLMRDLCISNVSLFIMTVIAFIAVSFIVDNVMDTFKMACVPLVYLIIMFFVTQAAARQRAERFVELVIKNDCIEDIMIMNKQGDKKYTNQ